MVDTSPAGVRAIRGDESRAAFARRLGVTPLTVYRWELPEERPDARRPRGASLAKLEGIGTPALPANDEVAALWPFVERVLEGDLRAAKTELVDRLVTAPLRTPDGRALASVALALADVLGRYDGRSAITSLAHAITDAEGGLLQADIAARVYATASFVYSLPDGRLLDPGKVQTFGARAEALDARADIVTLVRLGAVQAAIASADSELLARAFDRLERDRPAPLLLRLLHDEVRGLEHLLAGRATTSMRAFEKLVEESAGGPTLVWVRAMSYLAMRRLDALAPPAEVLADVERARAVARRERIEHGPHNVFLCRAAAEASLRLGHLADARAALAELDALDDGADFCSLSAVASRVRVAYVTGDVEDLRALEDRLRQIRHPTLQGLTLANLAFVEATIALFTEPPIVASQAYARAAVLSRRWPLLDREVTLYRVLSHVVAGETAAADASLLHLGRIGEAMTSGWLSAQILRLEASVHAMRLDWARARPLLDASAETLARGGDRPAAALCRYMRAALAEAFDDPEREPDAVSTSRAGLDALGIPPPAVLAVGIGIIRARPEAKRLGAHEGMEALLVPFQRLSVRGASLAFLERELVSVVERLFHTTARLETVSDATHVSALSESAAELSDGTGRRLRITVPGLVSADDRALLSLVAMHGALAMERAAGRTEEVVDDVVASKEVPDFIAASPALRRIRGELARLAPSRSTVIVTGESGSGKEVVARALHSLSERKDGPFVAFNCAAVPRDLFEGQLFGYRRGAFTGATTNHPGVIRTAAGGTLFLDEIGELPLDVQPKLLRFLDRGEIMPLGEERPRAVDVRVVTATHRDLAVLVRNGQFREDLYYRLQVVPIEVPPLRERPEDVVALARHFVRTLGRGTVLAPDAIAKLTRHAWPGNVRELRNVIERALAYSPSPAALRADHITL